MAQNGNEADVTQATGKTNLSQDFLGYLDGNDHPIKDAMLEGVLAKFVGKTSAVGASEGALTTALTEKFGKLPSGVSMLLGFVDSKIGDDSSVLGGVFALLSPVIVKVAEGIWEKYGLTQKLANATGVSPDKLALPHLADLAT